MILSFINIRKVPGEMLKTLGFALGFQHLPRDLANVNEWKIMFDPYSVVLFSQTIFIWKRNSQRQIYFGKTQMLGEKYAQNSLKRTENTYLP